MKKSIVAAIRTNPKHVIDDIEKVMTMAGVSQALDPGNPTILKDNISWHLFFPGANTTPWQLEGAILALQTAGLENILTVHNRTVVNDPIVGSRLNNLDSVYQHYGIEEKFNYRSSDITWESYTPKAKTPALDHVYPEGFLIPKQFFGTNIVHLPTIKCHVYTTTTGAMKNAFGGLLNTRRHYTHSHIHRTLVDLLHVQKEIHSGIFALMDGTHAGNGPGPRTMKPVQKDILLASADQVAIDAVAAKLMGFDPMQIGYIKMADDEGLGCGNPREIEVVGDDITNESWRFNVGDNLASSVGGQLWFGPLKRLQKLFFHTPLVGIFILASYIYHDYVWYPLKGRSAVKQFHESEWGRMFRERYAHDGILAGKQK